MKIKKIPTKYSSAYKARIGVTFQKQNVPEEWKYIHGKNVFTAVSSLKKENLTSFGISSPETMGIYIGIIPTGSFSII